MRNEMSDNHEQNRNITPKGRSPIHSTMGRYGITDSINRQNLATHNAQGTDVVDANVMSKMAHQSSPIQLRKRMQRSNSYSENPEYSDDEDNSNMLSKSLPPTLPSHLYSSDESGPETEELSCSQTKSKTEENSFNYSSGNQSSDSQYNYLQNQIPFSSRYEERSQDEGIKSYYYIFFVLLIIIIAIIWQFYFTSYKTQNKSTQTVYYDEVAFENNMDNLKQKYNIDDNSILKLKSGISTIFSKMDAGSFMFLYNSTTDNFNPMRFDMFINEVAHTAARYLRNNITPIQHTVVVSSSLDMQEHGELISRYRDDVDKTGVMLVKEVDAVPSDLAMAFHYYCDEYEPLVKRSAIFFTLNLANCSNTLDTKSTHNFIEKCLTRKWQSVPPENMRPLLTRIVDIIIDVTRVF